MRSRAFRPIAAILSALLLGGTPVHAGPVTPGEVVQVVGRYQNSLELRLRAGSQTAGAPVAAGNGATAVNSQSATAGSSQGANGTRTSQNNSADSLLSGVALSSDEPQGTNCEVIEEANLEGTICDCGEIVLPGSGLPKWPLLFLAGIPLIFIHGCDTCETSTPIPTPPGPTPTPPAPTPTPPGPPQIPEPASLLLFGSGLLAFAGGLRRRRAKGKLTAQRGTTEEG